MKYYAVVSGKVPGIYTDWKTTENMVKGHPGAIYKGFSSRTDAEEFMKSSTFNRINYHESKVMPLIDRTIIYTDGSYTNNKCGFGVVILNPNNEKVIAYGRVPLNPSNNVGELYAIYVGLSLVKGDVVIHTDSHYAISCLTTYVHNWMKNGWNGVANRNLIEGIYSLMQNRKISFQHVKAHTGIEFNEEADRLANNGKDQNEPLVIYKNGLRVNIMN